MKSQTAMQGAGNKNALVAANFLGIDVNAIRMEQFLALLDAWKAQPQEKSRYIACLNAYCLALASRQPRLAATYALADLAVPDGMPFVWWMRHVHKFKTDRLAGPDLIAAMAAHSLKTGHSFYLYGGHPEVVHQMKINLEAQFPHIRIKGYHSPPFRELSASEDQEIITTINRLQPDIVLVGLGTPKQDFWIRAHLDKIENAVLIGVGAAFDFYGGRIKRAPDWIGKSGLEWVYRLCSNDFRRLWYRYTVMHGVFMWNFLLQQLGRKRFRPRPAKKISDS